MGAFSWAALALACFRKLRADRNMAIDRAVAACFHLKIATRPTARQPVGLRQRAEGGGIFLDGSGAATLSKNCAQIETWPSIGQVAACFRLEIAIGPIAHQLAGLRRRAEGGGIFSGGAGADLLSKTAHC